MKPIDTSSLINTENIPLSNFFLATLLGLLTSISLRLPIPIGILVTIGSGIGYALVYATVKGLMGNKSKQKFFERNGLVNLESYDAIPPSLEVLHTLPVLMHIFALDVQGYDAAVYYHQVVNEQQANPFFRENQSAGPVFPKTVMAINLKNQYPHLYLDSHHKISRFSFQASQRIRLEGNFNVHFSLYAIEDGQVDALSIITPDVMSTILEYGHDFDIELYHDRLFIIAKGDAYDPIRMANLINFGNMMIAEFSHKNRSWNVNRSGLQAPLVGANGSNLPSANLKRSGPWLRIAVIIICIAGLTINILTSIF